MTKNYDYKNKEHSFISKYFSMDNILKKNPNRVSCHMRQ